MNLTIKEKLKHITPFIKYHIYDKTCPDGAEISFTFLCWHHSFHLPRGLAKFLFDQFYSM